MADPLYPNVPFVAGVPPVFRSLDVANRALIAATDVATLLTNDAAFFGLFSGAGAQWGLFDDGGQSVIAAEVVASMDYRREFRVADFPIEDGKFASYNKVQLPYDVRLTFVQAGTVDDRTGVLQQVASACETLQLYVAVTPEFSYDQVNVVSFEYRRTAQSGASMLTIEVFCREVRLVQQGQFSQTKQDPAAADSQNQGAVSTTTPTTSQQATALQSTVDGRHDRDSVLVRDGRRDQG